MCVHGDAPVEPGDGPRFPALGICGLLMTGFLALSIASYHHTDLSGDGETLGNLCGTAGAWLGHGLVRSFGVVAWYWVVVGTGLSLWALLRGPHRRLGRRFTGILLLALVAPGLLHRLPWRMDELITRWGLIPCGGQGGNLGWLLYGADEDGGLLTAAASVPGALLILTTLTVLALHLMDLPVAATGRRLVAAWQRARQAAAERQAQRHRLPPRSARDSTGSTPSGTVAPISARPAGAAEDAPGHISAPFRAVDPGEVRTVGQRLKERESTAGLGEAKELVERIRQQRRRATGNRIASEEGEEKTPVDRRSIAISLLSQRDDASPLIEEEDTTAAAVLSEAHNTAFSPLPTTDSDDVEDDEGDRDDGGDEDEDDSADAVVEDASPTDTKKPSRRRRRRKPTTYALPTARILDAGPDNDPDSAAAETERTSRFIEEIFAQYKVNVKVVVATRGPYITQYELELLDAGMRINKVANLEQELSLNLGTEGIRIVAPLPNKTTIGVEVPNHTKEAVVMRDLVEKIDPEAFTLPLIIGRDVIGGTLIGDLSTMPHLLVAGATGMGKSVCLNAIICSLLLFRDPDEVKLIMVDPKMVELAPYEGIPHLLTPPITDMTKAHAALEWACSVMDHRYFALRLAGVRDIKSYNALGETELQQRLERKGKSLEDLNGVESTMPFIVIVVDEYADLMMVNKEVEKSIVRLTAKSRACGIHIILTTQRPSADVVTGLIKSNLPCRICFRVADRNNSRVVLDASGAQNLLGKGDMLFLPPGVSSLIRGQGVWVKDHEIEAIIAHVKEQGAAVYDDNIFRIGAAAMQGGGGSDENQSSAWIGDRKFHEAVQAMYRYNKTGADFLRRKMAIGYNKATQYIEWLEDLGFLSESKGTKPREFLRDWQDWLDELRAAGVEWEEDDDIYYDPFA